LPWPDIIYPFIFYEDLTLLFALELSVESIVLLNSKMPCYSKFYKHLSVKQRLGSIKVNNKGDVVRLELPWLGVEVVFHDHGPHVHVHRFDINDKLDLKNLTPSPPKGEPREVWAPCTS
jgi:hypothetical protein